MEIYFKKSIGSHRKGSTKNINENLARFYIKNGIAEIPVKGNTYQTKVMVAEPVKDQYDGLSVEELRELAKERGVKVHHNSGEAKIKEALREHSEE